MSGNNDAEIAKIEELFAQWDAAVESSNLDGYVDGLDENITLMPPGGVVIKGKENYRKFLGPVFESATYTVTNNSPKTYEIFGDIAIIHSHLTVNLTFKDGASSIASEGAIQDNSSEGKYLDVLRKQEDGSWKCLVHTWEQIN